MTASIVQTASNAATGATVAASFAAAPTAGNTVLAIVNSNNVFTVDGDGTRRFQYLADQQFDIWEYTGTLPQTVTATPGAADYVAITLLELTGTTALDLAGTDTSIGGGGKVSATAPSIDATVADLVLAVVALHGSDAGDLPASPVWDNGFIVAASTLMPTGAVGQSAACGQWVGSKSVTAGAVGATTVTWSNGADNADAVLIAYKASGGEEPPAATPTGIYVRQSGAWVVGSIYRRTGGTWQEATPTNA